MILILINILIVILIIISIIYYHKKINSIKPYIIISLTTSPKRIIHTKNIIDNMFLQTIKPNKIIFNIPHIFKRTNQYYTIPDFLNHKDIIINRCEDLGPITKVIPTFYLDLPDNTIIISIDDDIYYGNNMIETIIEYHKKYPNTVFTSSGMIQNKMIAGFSGVVYPYLLLKNANINLDVPDVCKFSDDFIISNFLLNNNIPILGIGGYTFTPLRYGLEEDALHKGGAIKPEKDINDAHLINYRKCAEYYKSINELNIGLEFWLTYKP